MGEDLPEEKIKSLSKILGKFFEQEAEDYKKEQAIKSPPDYEALQKKTARGNMDFSLKSAIIEINRDADRRYQFATMKIRTQERAGKKFPQSSPLLRRPLRKFPRGVDEAQQLPAFRVRCRQRSMGLPM